MRSRETIRAALTSILQDEMGEPCPPLGDELDLRSGLGLDSVDLIGVVMRLEREYHVRLSMEELAKVDTVGDMIDLLLAKPAAEREAMLRDMAA